MKPVELNLASRPFRNDTPIAVVFGLLAVGAIAFTAFNTYGYLTADAREEVLSTELADHRTRMQALATEAEQLKRQLDLVDVETLRSQASFVASVLLERNFSWTDLFNELEKVVPWNVRLSSIRPGFSSGRVHIDSVGSAQNVKAFFEFQEALESSKPFSNVLPTQYRVNDQGGRATFNLKFEYTPRSVEEEREDLQDRDAPAKRIVVQKRPKPVEVAAKPAPVTAAKPDPVTAEKPVPVAAPSPKPTPARQASGGESAEGPATGRGARTGSAAATPEERRGRRANRKRVLEEQAAAENAQKPAGNQAGTANVTIGGVAAAAAAASEAKESTGPDPAATAGPTASGEVDDTSPGVKPEIERAPDGSFKRLKPVTVTDRPTETPPGSEIPEGEDAATGDQSAEPGADTAEESPPEQGGADR